MKTWTTKSARRWLRPVLETVMCGALTLGTSACAVGTEGEEGREVADGARAAAQNMTRNVAGRTLASIDYPDGRTVQFFEPEPGMVFIRERGPIGSVPLTTVPEAEGLTTAELYEYLSGEQAPAALAAATTRKPAAPTDMPPEGEGETPVEETLAPLRAPQSMLDGVAVTSAALSNGLTGEQFQTQLCPPTWRDEYFNWINVTGRGSLLRSDVLNFRSAAQSLRGTIHFTAKYRVWYTWSNMADLDLPAGWYEKVERRWSPGDYDFDARATVDDADGDLYNMCTHF